MTTATITAPANTSAPFVATANPAGGVSLLRLVQGAQLRIDRVPPYDFTVKFADKSELILQVRTVEGVTQVRLSPFTVTVTTEVNDDITVTFANLGAESYRVLFTNANNEVSEYLNATSPLTIPAAVRTLGGEIIVESYDAIGNSIFSNPVTVSAI